MLRIFDQSEPSARPLESTVPPTRRANAAANVAMPVDGHTRAFRSGRRMQRGTLRPMQKVSESSAEMQVWTLVLRNLREESVAAGAGLARTNARLSLRVPACAAPCSTAWAAGPRPNPHQWPPVGVRRRLREEPPRPTVARSRRGRWRSRVRRWPHRRNPARASTAPLPASRRSAERRAYW